jgi:hypothetical protein
MLKKIQLKARRSEDGERNNILVSATPNRNVGLDHKRVQTFGPPGPCQQHTKKEGGSVGLSDHMILLRKLGGVTKL